MSGNRQVTFYDKTFPIKNFSAVIVLDNLNDPRNVGVILRLADAFGIREVYACGQTPVPPHILIKRTARGMEKHLNIRHFKTTEEALLKLRSESFHLIAIEYTNTSTNLRDFHFNPAKSYALIAGSEEMGVSSGALEIVNDTCHISQFGHGLSLNVSSAMAIAFYELSSQLSK